jgi:hypothetical protein
MYPMFGATVKLSPAKEAGNCGEGFVAVSVALGAGMSLRGA